MYYSWKTRSKIERWDTRDKNTVSFIDKDTRIVTMKNWKNVQLLIGMAGRFVCVIMIASAHRCAGAAHT